MRYVGPPCPERYASHSLSCAGAINFPYFFCGINNAVRLSINVLLLVGFDLSAVALAKEDCCVLSCCKRFSGVVLVILVTRFGLKPHARSSSAEFNDEP